MEKIELGELITSENYNEEGYLLANLDVLKAVKEKKYASGKEHFEIFGRNEVRYVYSVESLSRLGELRAEKMDRIGTRFRDDLPSVRQNGKVNFLTPDLREAFKIIDTDNVSANRYDQPILDVVHQYADGLILDCGAGLRNTYFSNVYNYEIADYVTTDVLGVGEVLPFRDETFDAVISIAVLEHVKDPFKCASEISRVLKRGGTLISCIPFLQPFHGYPHHYYNMTYQGHENLYNRTIDIQSIRVLESMTPIYTLTWFLQKYTDGLASDESRQAFLDMPVREFMRSPQSFTGDRVVSDLRKDVELELACATFLTGIKK